MLAGNSLKSFFDASFKKPTTLVYKRLQKICYAISSLSFHRTHTQPCASTLNQVSLHNLAKSTRLICKDFKI